MVEHYHLFHLFYKLVIQTQVHYLIGLEWVYFYFYSFVSG